jgi:hypothetical protein
MNKGAIFHGACGYFHVEINIVYIRIKLKDVGLCHGAAFFFLIMFQVDTKELGFCRLKEEEENKRRLRW